MSSKSYASGSVRSCAGSVRLGTAGGHELVLDALYERKRDNKSVRVVTVIIYVFCVSLAAIMLSLYYVFFWEPKDAPYAQRKVQLTVEKQSTSAPPTCFIPHTGGSDSGVSAHVDPGPVNITNVTNTFNARAAETTTQSLDETSTLDHAAVNNTLYNGTDDTIT